MRESKSVVKKIMLLLSLSSLALSSLAPPDAQVLVAAIEKPHKREIAGAAGAAEDDEPAAPEG